MTETATIQTVPRPRGTVTETRIAIIDACRDALRLAEVSYRLAVLRAMEEGASFSEVSKATGLSTNTLQRWKREAGK